MINKPAGLDLLNSHSDAESHKLTRVLPHDDVHGGQRSSQSLDGGNSASLDHRTVLPLISVPQAVHNIRAAKSEHPSLLQLTVHVHLRRPQRSGYTVCLPSAIRVHTGVLV